MRTPIIQSYFNKIERCYTHAMPFPGEIYRGHATKQYPRTISPPSLKKPHPNCSRWFKAWEIFYTPPIRTCSRESRCVWTAIHILDFVIYVPYIFINLISDSGFPDNPNDTTSSFLQQLPVVVKIKVPPHFHLPPVSTSNNRYPLVGGRTIRTIEGIWNHRHHHHHRCQW